MGFDYKIPMGQCDIPLIQKQPVFYMEPFKYHTAVFGGPMSGKTTFIKTLLVRLHEKKEEFPQEEIYLIDFGGNIGEYGNLGKVCACFDSSNEENIKRVFKLLEKRLIENAKMLGSSGYYQVVTEAPEKAPTHLYLIIENISAFLTDERYENYRERMFKLCRDGLSKGLTVVFTANETYGLGRLLSYFGQKISFHMQPESYYEIFGMKTLNPMKIPGRGLVTQDSHIYEFQAFLPFPVRKDETPYLNNLLRRTTAKENPNRMQAFPAMLTVDNFSEYCGRNYRDTQLNDEIIVGLNYDEHRPVCVDITGTRSIAFYGKMHAGKMHLLRSILKGVVKQHPEASFIYLDDVRRQMEPFYQPGVDQISDNSMYFDNVPEIRDYLANHGYGIKASSSRSAHREEGKLPVSGEEKEQGMTVFVLQSKALFRATSDAKYLASVGLPMMISEADEKNYVFVFPDVPPITNADVSVPFTSAISLAFLLDDIGDFVIEKGSGSKSVFGEMDARELKMEYAHCDDGEGYVYNVGMDELEKFKFIQY